MKKRALTTISTNARTFLLARLLLYALGISAAAKRENRSKSIGRLTGSSSTTLSRGYEEKEAFGESRSQT